MPLARFRGPVRLASLPPDYESPYSSSSSDTPLLLRKPDSPLKTIISSLFDSTSSDSSLCILLTNRSHLSLNLLTVESSMSQKRESTLDLCSLTEATTGIKTAMRTTNITRLSRKMIRESSYF